MTDNDPAERLYLILNQVRPSAITYLDRALAAERRATVERIRAEVERAELENWSLDQVHAILDAERDR